MKKNLRHCLVIATLVVMVGCSSDDDDKAEALPQQTETVIYLLRHAEKAENTPDPNLSSAGSIRAFNWWLMLREVDFETVYSTNYRRTVQTAQPTADGNFKSISLYNPGDLLLEDVVLNHPGKNVMIVGHSNTIPQMINEYLGSGIYPDILENEYGNLYKITVEKGEVTHVLTVHN